MWHRPGDNRFSSTHSGGASIREMIGPTMEASAGSFKISVIGPPIVNGALVATPVRFSAQRDGASIAMDDIDLMQFEGDQIVEVPPPPTHCP